MNTLPSLAGEVTAQRSKGVLAMCSPLAIIPDAMQPRARMRANHNSTAFAVGVLRRWSGIALGKFEFAVPDPVLAVRHFVLHGTRDDGERSALC